MRGGNFSVIYIKSKSLYFLSIFHFANRGKLEKSIHSIFSMTLELSL